jgi:hypothetical protein
MYTACHRYGIDACRTKESIACNSIAIKRCMPLPDNIVYDYVVYKSGFTYCAVDSTGATTSKSSFNRLMGSINTALSSGGKVFIKRGTYDSDSSGFNITNSIDIVGAGRGKTVIRRVVSQDFNSTIYVPADNVTIKSLTIDGNYRSFPSTKGELYFDGTSGLAFDVEVKNFREAAITLGNSGIKNRISHCVITGVNVDTSTARFGVRAAEGTEAWIDHCNIQYCSLNAVFAGGNTNICNCYIANNALASGGQLGADDGTNFFSVENCVIAPGLGANTIGIELSKQTTGGGDFIAIGNKITGQSGQGIVSNGGPLAPTSTVIKDNIIKNCGGNGIMMGNGAHSHFVIAGNICYDDQETPTQPHGISVPNSTTNHFIIQNNICWGNTLGQIEDATGRGADKVVSGNITA